MGASHSFWDDLAARPQPTLLDMIEAEGQRRVAALVHHVADIRFDWAKTHLNAELLESFAAEADRRGCRDQLEMLFNGGMVNPTEGRAAEHTAERGTGDADAVARADMLHERMRALIDAIEVGAFGEIDHIIHIGIGGSALGPDLLIDALGRASDRYDVAVVSNVDGQALEHATRRMNPLKTLVVVASKTFTTTETMLNANSARVWLAEGGVDDPYGRMIALTASPDKALAWGIDETRVLPFAESVGGRYSLWSSIGFPAALALGWGGFEALLQGAAAMDAHVRSAPWTSNVAAVGAFSDLYYARVRHAQTRAVFAYDERLRLLPSYLQQLEMESNGKSVTRDGKPLDGDSAPITWGGVGTDAQHAVFQLLHQGTHLVPVEFVLARETSADLDPAHHRALLINAVAQGAALMTGRTNADGARAYAGNRPSTSILLPDVTPAALGALLAFYEHRVFLFATMLEINPFDQFGVELGKEMAKALDGGDVAFDPATAALFDAALGDG